MTDIEVDIPTYGKIIIDISYGGAFYVLCDVTQVILHLTDTPIGDLVNFATTLSDQVKKTIEIKHPVEEDLGFLYGVILTNGKDVFDANEGTKNLCVFADRQVPLHFTLDTPRIIFFFCCFFLSAMLYILRQSIGSVLLISFNYVKDKNDTTEDKNDNFSVSIRNRIKSISLHTVNDR